MRTLLLIAMLAGVALFATNPTGDEYLVWLKSELASREKDDLDKALIMWAGGPLLALQTTRKDGFLFSFYVTEIDGYSNISAVGFLRQFVRIPEPKKEPWAAGRALAGRPHVVAATSPGQWVPEEGYSWVGNPSATGDFSVRWTPGKKSSLHAHIVAAPAEGRWLPEVGYAWVISPPVAGDLRVKWIPGTPSPTRPHVVTSAIEGQWIPERGYVWASNPPALADFQVRPLQPVVRRVTPNQQRAGCSYEDGQLMCPGPGTGLCWAEGHNPYLDEPPLSIDVGINPKSPDFGHEERCSVAR